MPKLRGVGTSPALPADFARHLAEILEPGDEHDAAQVLQAAIRLDDARLGTFLELLAERVRSSAQAITGDELRALLRAATRGARGGT